MVTSAAETIKEILEFAEYPVFKQLNLEQKRPKVYILYVGEKRRYIHHGINITNESYNPDYTFAGTVIIHTKEAFIEIYAQSDRARDAIFEDVEAIFAASSYDVTLKEIHFFDYKNRYRVECIGIILRG